MKHFGWLHLVIGFALASLAAAAAASAGVAGPDFAENSYMVTFKPSTPIYRSPIVPPSENVRKRSFDNVEVPFPQHSTGQSKSALAASLGIRGKVKWILDAINAAALEIDAVDAERLRHDPRVLRVDQDMVARTQSVQFNPGWALDRLDQPTGQNGQYAYNATGSGRTVVVLDSGLNLANPAVSAEFGGRAQVFYDYNGGGGQDCHPLSHGTKVASAAAGNTYGTAKGARLLAVKVTIGCTDKSYTSNWAAALNWFALNAPRGTIVNLSQGLFIRDANGKFVCGTVTNPQVEDAVRKAYGAGIIVVVAAMNDGCDAANYTPTRMPEAFVVGATDSNLLPVGKDARAWFSRYGTNISTFAPGVNVPLMNANGAPELGSGTSFAAPYIAGIFAAACQIGGTYCDTMPNAGSIYSLMRSIATLNTVVESNGGPLPAGTVSRFVTRGAW